LEVDFGWTFLAGQARTTVVDINEIVDVLRINNLIDFNFNFKRPTKLDFLTYCLKLIIFLLVRVHFLLNLVFADSQTTFGLLWLMHSFFMVHEPVVTMI
jgi:hypothetical protein